MTTVPAEDLRFDYEPFDQPIRNSYPVGGGETYESVQYGRMRAVWDSPEGPYSLVWAADHDLSDTYANEPALREEIAKRMAASYDQSAAVRRTDPQNSGTVWLYG